MPYQKGENVEPYSISLDPDQEALVRSDSKRTLAVCGPGSGKTRCLIERVAYLVEERHTSPFEIYCNTYTRKAGQEIKERLEARIGKKAHNILAGTLHATALKMVQRFGDVIGLKPNSITVYGQFETDFMMRETARDIGFVRGKNWKVPKRTVEKMLSDYYDLCIDPPENDPAKPLFDAFNQRTKENNSLCYDQLLIALESLIPTLAKHLHIRHIMIDECQDYTARQWQIVSKMVDAFGASLFAVGDGDQSIFSFRNAVPEYLINHQHDFDIYRLETNYRSCPEIVEASNRLIRHNSQRIDKTMRAERGGKGSVEIWKDCDSAKLAEVSIFTNPEAVKNTAILARVHALLKKLSTELTARGIPHTYVGRKSALANSEEFRRFTAFLKLIVNPYDNFAFLLIKDLIGLSAEKYSMVRVMAATGGLSHFEAWQALGEASKNWTHFFGGAQDLSLKQTVHNLSIYLELQTEGLGTFGDETQFIDDWLAQNPNGTIKQYLDWLATYDLQDELSEDQEGLVLSTIHGAKGLEWTAVIIAGANEGIIPSKQAIAAGEIEEERRLMYVAMTRARDHLVVAVRPERTEKDDRVYESPRSRFVEEMS